VYHWNKRERWMTAFVDRCFQKYARHDVSAPSIYKKTIPQGSKKVLPTWIFTRLFGIIIDDLIGKKNLPCLWCRLKASFPSAVLAEKMVRCGSVTRYSFAASPTVILPSSSKWTTEGTNELLSCSFRITGCFCFRVNDGHQAVGGAEGRCRRSSRLAVNFP